MESEFASTAVRLTGGVNILQKLFLVLEFACVFGARAVL
jgi:hypothetical protein